MTTRLHARVPAPLAGRRPATRTARRVSQRCTPSRDHLAAHLPTAQAPAGDPLMVDAIVATLRCEYPELESHVASVAAGRIADAARTLADWLSLAADLDPAAAERGTGAICQLLIYRGIPRRVVMRLLTLSGEALSRRDRSAAALDVFIHATHDEMKKVLLPEELPTWWAGSRGIARRAAATFGDEVDGQG